MSRICAADPLERLQGVEPGPGAGELAQPLEVVREHGQLARQADEVVELPGVDPDPRRHPGQREWRVGAGEGAAGFAGGAEWGGDAA